MNGTGGGDSAATVADHVLWQVTPILAEERDWKRMAKRKLALA